uniref:Uncharacterized protein n=1 Tax=Panagrolaimus sp. JU765 TaxID=591449 RepID=A0AC34REQ7_9BILA
MDAEIEDEPFEQLEDDNESNQSDFHELDPNAVYESAYVKTHVHTSDAVVVAVSPDGAFVATGGCDNKAYLFMLSRSYKLPAATFAADDTVDHISFSPDSKYVAFIAGEDLYVSNLHRGRPPQKFAYSNDYRFLVWYLIPDYYPSGAQNFLLTVAQSQRCILSIEVGASLDVVKEIYVNSNAPSALIYDEHKNVGVAAFEDRTVTIFSVIDFHIIASLDFPDSVVDIKAGLDGILCFALFDGRVNFCIPKDDTYKSVSQIDYKRQEGPSSCCALGLAGSHKFLAVGSLSGNVEVYDLTMNRIRYAFSTNNTSVVSMMFNNTATKLFISTYDGCIYVIDVKSGQRLDVLHSFGAIKTFDVAMKEVDDHLFACAVNARGHLRYFVWPFADKVWKMPPD